MEQQASSIDRVFLVGFMGAGKTTVGRLLAQRLGWMFVDLDDCIWAREGRAIADMFRELGEEYFRRVESECLQSLLAETQLPRASHSSVPGGVTRNRFVIALGGGAFVRAENAVRIRETRAPVVFLDAAVEELRRRCEAMGGARPLFRDENQFRQLYEARRSGYMAADLRVDTGGKTPVQVVDETVDRLHASGYEL